VRFELVSKYLVENCWWTTKLVLAGGLMNGWKGLKLGFKDSLA
jgi:hypothetical protein